jgi:two-component system, chemotaxis family, sensor histidine kinase and response regulator WspE
VLVIGGRGSQHGLVVDRFLGGRELVVRPLDPRLGKIKDISAAALLEDGAPVLIVDVEDLIRSMEKLAEADRLDKVEGAAGGEARQRKRVLVVDDSLTVRELERKLLDRQGYRVEVAVDGMDGWNMLRGSRFDLVITDIDMPRMDGIELVTNIRKDSTLRSLPVMVVSYKDREEDRRRGLEAGADYYLTKSSFQDDTLMQAVADLIGAAA